MATFHLPLPRAVWPYWCLAVIAVVGLPLTSYVYFDALLRSGTLPTNGDTIAIPIFFSVVLAVLISPIAALTTYCCVWRYPSTGTLLSWRPSQPIFSGAVTLIFGLPALTFAYMVVEPVLKSLPTIEYIWTPYLLLVIAWLLLLRAAAVTPRLNVVRDEAQPASA